MLLIPLINYLLAEDYDYKEANNLEVFKEEIKVGKHGTIIYLNGLYSITYDDYDVTTSSRKTLAQRVLNSESYEVPATLEGTPYGLPINITIDQALIEAGMIPMGNHFRMQVRDPVFNYMHPKEIMLFDFEDED